MLIFGKYILTLHYLFITSTYLQFFQVDIKYLIFLSVQLLIDLLLIFYRFYRGNFANNIARENKHNSGNNQHTE